MTRRATQTTILAKRIMTDFTPLYGNAAGFQGKPVLETWSCGEGQHCVTQCRYHPVMDEIP
jgi:hypothetical protein